MTGRARALLAEARALLDAGDALAARPLLDEALALCREARDAAALAEAEALLARTKDPPPVVPPTG